MNYIDLELEFDFDSFDNADYVEFAEAYSPLPGLFDRADV